MNQSEKPTKAKPALYAQYYFQLKQIAQEYGYNLLLHGSMDRDLDLVAVPWVDEPKDELDLVKAFHKHLTGLKSNEKSFYFFSTLPGGRNSYVINLNRGGAWNGYVDNQYYLDISFTPLNSNQ